MPLPPYCLLLHEIPEWLFLLLACAGCPRQGSTKQVFILSFPYFCLFLDIKLYSRQMVVFCSWKILRFFEVIKCRKNVVNISVEFDLVIILVDFHHNCRITLWWFDQLMHWCADGVTNKEKLQESFIYASSSSSTSVAPGSLHENISVSILFLLLVYSWSSGLHLVTGIREPA